MSDLDRVRFGGKTVDRRTAQMLAESERLANERDPSIGAYRLTQGSWSHAGASAGTHEGPGAFDQYTRGYSAEQKEIISLAHRTVGFASWRRERIPGKWEEHWHGIAIGTEGLPPVAERQVQSYLDGKDGLVGQRQDREKRPEHILTWEQYKVQHGVGPSGPSGERGADSDPAPQDEREEAEAELESPKVPFQEAVGSSAHDSDSDGLSNKFEKLTFTNPKKSDTDGDGLGDAVEAALGTNPTLVDSDFDGLSDGLEVRHKSDAVSSFVGASGSTVQPSLWSPREAYLSGRADPYGIEDGKNIRHVGLAPGADGANHDQDKDGLTDAFEEIAGTDRRDEDSDNDGKLDGFEALVTRTDPRSDQDGGLPGVAGVVGTGAFAEKLTSKVRDADQDGLSDQAEGVLGTSTESADSDDDQLSDSAEVARGTDPTSPDSDFDGIFDGVEVRFHQDPLTADSDLSGGEPASTDLGID